jgi:hypothetical protein
MMGRFKMVDEVGSSVASDLAVLNTALMLKI